MKILPATLLTAAVSTAGSAVAEQPENYFALGIGVAAEQSIYSGVDNQSSAIPLFAAEYNGFFLNGMELGYQLVDDGDFGLAISIAGDELDGERTDGPLLKDMGDVDSGVNLKLSADMATDVGLFEFSVAQDVSSEHKGTAVTADWALPLEITPRLTVFPGVGVSWLSEDITNHYYGVTTAQARAGRAAYKADSSFIYRAGVDAEYLVNEQWIIRAGLEYQQFGDEISDSSIVEDDSSVGGFIGAMYRF